MAGDGIDERARRLYDEGARLLEEAWDDEAGLVRHVAQHGAFHDGRASLAYARVLLRRGSADDIARAARIIAAVAEMQETREQDAHYGNFRWFSEDPGVHDLNAVEFILDHLNALWREGIAALGDRARALIERMMALGLDEIDRLDVHPSYTNIALSDVANSVLGGEALGAPQFAERGARRLAEWFEFTNRSGAPHEYNSPTYLAVDIARMAALAGHTLDDDVALRARVAEELLWLHAAAHVHPGMAQLAGPHSRSYRDGWTGAGGYLKLMLWKLTGDDGWRRPTPYYPRGREEGHTGVAMETLHCPPYIAAWLREKRYPFECVETADAARGIDITTYLREGFALGTASASYGVGEPPEFWPGPNSVLLHFRRDAAPGYGTLLARYIVDDRGDPGPDGDLWDEGVHACAQHRNRAIVAYGLRPRLRGAHSCKLSVRALGIDEHAEVWAGGRRVAAYPLRLEPGEPVTIAAGAAYVALIPLEPTDMGAGAPIELHAGGGLLALDIYNYAGPSKSFWEHRSQAGPFYKGNVRNAFVLEVADAADFADFAAFRAHIAAARIADSVDEEYVREIAYESGGGAIALRYSLWDMRVIERRCGGVPFAAPMGRAGATGGGGAQWARSRDSMIELAGATLLAGRAPKWLFADADARRYVFVNPSDEVNPLWLETPATIVECDAFGFGRVEVDEPAGTIAVEASGEIGALRIRAADGTRLAINGSDVTDALLAPDAAGVREFRGL